MQPTPVEREIKLRFASAEAAREDILAAGASPLRGRRLQDDCLLDQADETLRRARSVLRIRTEAGKSRLTYKGPVQPSTMKLREELETIVGDGEVVRRLFAELGYRPWFRYQKYREEFSHEDVIIALDETPIGTFVELEGSEAGIRAFADRLGRPATDYVLDSYRTLFVRWREATGATAAHMTFENE